MQEAAGTAVFAIKVRAPPALRRFYGMLSTPAKSGSDNTTFGKSIFRFFIY